MKKWMIAAGGILAVLLNMTIPAAARVSLAGAQTDHSRVYDMADLFTEQQEEELSEQISAQSEEMGMDLAVVTTADAAGYSSRVYADYFYDDNGMGTGQDNSGALFLIDMDNREIAVSTSGEMWQYLTDERVEQILDAAYGPVSEGNYFESAKAFLSGTEDFYREGIPDGQYTYDAETGRILVPKKIEWYEFLFALAAAAVCGAAAAGAARRSYSMQKGGTGPEAEFRLSYRKDSAFHAGSVLRDVLIGSYVTSQIIRRNTGGRSGGGSRSGGRSGRTTVHRTGGRRHGGGSRKF